MPSRTETTVVETTTTTTFTGSPPDRAVRFLRRHDRYNKGDVAGFPPEFAARLVTLGLAVALPPAAVMITK